MMMLMKFMLFMLFTQFMLSSKLRENRVLQMPIIWLGWMVFNQLRENFMKSKYFKVKKNKFVFGEKYLA